MRRSVVLLVVGLLISVGASAAEVQGYRAPGVFDAEAHALAKQQLASWLSGQEAEGLLHNPVVVRLSRSELAEIEGGEAQDVAAERKLLVGLVKPVNALVDLGALEHGALKRVEAGLMWSGVVSAPGANAMRIRFTDLDLPEGAELYLYNDHGEAFGPYTDRGPLGSSEFWSDTLVGDEARIQVRGGDADTYFTIADVGYMGSAFLYGAYQRENPEKAFCSFNEDCVINASCTSSSVVNNVKDAIAHYSFVQRPYVYICTGGLLADEGQSGTPYFLTANHCLSRRKAADTVETYFFFSSPCGQCNAPGAYNTIGSSVLSTNSTGDYTLLQLGGSAPTGAYFMGWSTDEVAYTANYDLYRISHPGGAPQAYSEHEVDPATGTCSSWPRGSWIYSKDTLGATEGGSSGSPVVNSSGVVVGQLSGACGFNVNDPCDSVSNATVDGAFASYYNEVAQWLGGGGTSCDDGDGDGYDDASCGGNDCDDSDFFVNPGVDEVCDDNIDNNCDGSIDEGCGGSECLPRGEPCTSNDECCSASCHPRKLTCK